MADNGEGKSGGVAAWLGAVAGLVSGAAAVAGLFMAKPDLITVVVPVQTLERVVERAQAQAAPQQTIEPAVQQATVAQQVSATQAVGQAQSLQGGLSVSVASLANTPNAIVANLRIANGGAAPVRIAGRYVNNSVGDFSASDAFGGSCPWSGRGATGSQGTLKMATGQFSQGQLMYADNFTHVQPGQSAVETLVFNKDACTTQISGTQPVTVSGTFVVVDNEATEARFASVSFEGIQPAQAQ